VDLKVDGVQKKEYVINRDRTELKPLSIFDFRCDRRYESIYDAPCCSDESRQTREQVIQKLRQGVYAGITEEEVLALGQKEAPPDNDGRAMQLQANGENLQKPKPENDILTSDWWGLFDLEGNGIRRNARSSFSTGRGSSGSFANNTWCPFPAGRTFRPSGTPVEGELYGIGLIEPITTLCLDLNDMQNTLNHAAA